MRNVSIACSLIAGILLALVACSGSDNQPTESGKASVIYRGNGGEPGSLDPALAEDVHAFNILADLYEGLVTESAAGELAPATAESWEISTDGLIYTFTLRAGARWSNGDAVTAHDFVRAFRRAASPETASTYGFLLQPLMNFSEVRNGSMPVDRLAVTAINDRILQIQLAEPAPHFLSVLTMPIASPVHASMAARTSFSVAGDFVGNGAYTMLGRDAGGPIRLRRSPTYWAAGSVTVEEIVYLPIVDPRTEFNMYRAGELDITNTIPPEDFESIRESLPDQVRVSPSLALYYLAFDTTEPPFDNRLLRQALTMAIDRERLVTLLGRGEQPAFGIVPHGVAAHTSAEFEWRNLAREEQVQQARAFYREAGYSDESPLETTYLYDTGDIHEKIALAVTSMWRDVLGVETRLEKREWQYFLETRERRADWQIMRFVWFGDYNHPSTFTNLFRSGDPQNLSAYANPDYDRLLKEASRDTAPSDPSKLIGQAEALLLADHPIAPLYFYVSKHLVHPRVGGFEQNALDRHPSKYLFLKPKPKN